MLDPRLGQRPERAPSPPRWAATTGVSPRLANASRPVVAGGSGGRPAAADISGTLVYQRPLSSASTIICSRLIAGVHIYMIPGAGESRPRRGATDGPARQGGSGRDRRGVAPSRAGPHPARAATPGGTGSTLGDPDKRRSGVGRPAPCALLGPAHGRDAPPRFDPRPDRPYTESMTTRRLRFATFLAPSMFSVYQAVVDYVGQALGCAPELVTGESFDVFAAGRPTRDPSAGCPTWRLRGSARPPWSRWPRPCWTGRGTAGGRSTSRT